MNHSNLADDVEWPEAVVTVARIAQQRAKVQDPTIEHDLYVRIHRRRMPAEDEDFENDHVAGRVCTVKGKTI